METFVATLTCEVSQLAGLRRRLERWLEANDVSEELRGSVVLATHEAAANAIEHAATAVEVRVALDHGTLTLEVADSGRWKPARVDEDERGRGLAIAGRLVPRLEIHTEPNGTIVRMTVSTL